MKLYFKKYSARNTAGEHVSGGGFTGDRNSGSGLSGNLPVLIILHGLFGAGGNWHTLANKDFSLFADVYALDQRNHGRSPHSESFTLDDMVHDLEEFMDSEEIEYACLLGHSMGGKIAMSYTLTHSDRVDKLIVVDIAPVAYPNRHEYIFDAMRGVDPSLFDSRTEIDRALARHVSSAPVRQFLMKNLSRENGVLKWIINLDAIYRAYTDVSGEITGWPPFSGDVLFIRGARSDYILDEHMPAIKHLFPRTQLITISNAGHWLHAENREEFSAAVVSFLTDGSTRSEIRTTEP